MKAEEIKTKADVDKWLAALPPPLREQGCQIIAYRHSLRLLPLLVKFAQDRREEQSSLLLAFRAFLLVLANMQLQGQKPEADLLRSVTDQINEVLSKKLSVGDDAAKGARMLLLSLSSLMNILDRKNDPSASRARGQTIKAIETGDILASVEKRVTVNAARRQIIDVVRYDAQLIEADQGVMDMPLWPEGADPLSEHWISGSRIFANHPAWSVFQSFYERTLLGERRSWQLWIDLGSEPDAFWTGTDEEVLDRVQAVVDNMEGPTGKTRPKRKSVSVRQDKTNLGIPQELADAIEKAQKLKQDLDLARVQMASLIRSGRTGFDEKISEINEEFNEQKEMLRQHIDGVVEAVKAGFALEEPVNLWTVKEKEHREHAKASYRWFAGALIVTGLFIGGIALAIVNNASFILQAIAPLGCDPVNAPQACSGFSFLGAVMIGLVLTLFTLLLWFTRLQMKEYLSERHLALDARERRAFAEFYIGLLRQEGVDSDQVNEQRAIIYAALFRPTIDGIVKEEGGLDPALTAALSRFLAR